MGLAHLLVNEYRADIRLPQCMQYQQIILCLAVAFSEKNGHIATSDLLYAHTAILLDTYKRLLCGDIYDLSQGPISCGIPSPRTVNSCNIIQLTSLAIANCPTLFPFSIPHMDPQFSPPPCPSENQILIATRRSCFILDKMSNFLVFDPSVNLSNSNNPGDSCIYIEIQSIRALICSE